MSDERIAVLGSGGHASVVVATLRAEGRVPAACFDDSPERWGTLVEGVPVVGPLEEADRSDCTHAVCAIGENVARRRVVERLDLRWTTTVHPFAWIAPGAVIGEGTVVFAGAIVQPGAVIGRHVIVNTKTSIDHHVHVGDFAHLAVAHLAGAASIGDGAFLALNSTVLPGVTVGEWSTVGAGAVVTRNVAAGVTVVGVPARSLGRRNDRPSW